MTPGKYACIILAAGEGRRAGGYKPLMPLGAEAVVDRVIAAASAVASEVRVVGGSEFARLEAHLARRWPGATVVVRNAQWERGMFSSVQAGLAGVPDAAFVHPADVPGTGAAVYRALAGAYESGARDVVRPVFEGRRGHPILLSPEAARAVQEADAEDTLRGVLAPFESVDVPVEDDLVLFDFDTLEELAALRVRLGVDPGRGA
jgi:CTP:molybdopterin cytidylyltransferase MocA